MSNQVKNYFLAPSWDYAPNGLLRIGNIIVSPKRPVPPLFTTSTSNLDSTDQDEATNGKTPPSVKDNVEWMREKTVAGKFGIWTKFLESLGINLGADISSEHSEVFKFDQIITEEFFPSDEYLQQAMASPKVAGFLKRHMLRKSVYVIVGVKVVIGAAVKRSLSKTASGTADVGLDGALTGAPVSLGPTVEFTRTMDDSVSFEGSSDFVFAFRVRKVKSRASGDVTQAEYNRGALFGIPSDEEHEVEDSWAGEIEDEDFTAGREGFECFEVADPGEGNVSVSIATTNK